MWDYPRPPALVNDSRLVKVLHHGDILAESRRAWRVLETASPPTFYIPPADLRREFLIRSDRSSECEWKGTATYWSMRDGGAADGARDVGWSYEQPYKEFGAIRGCVAFYPDAVECYVDAERVRPQPGEFYAGWVTSEVIGPFKGEPGTEDW